MLSQTSHSRLKAPFQTPKTLTLSKRKRASEAGREDDEGGSSHKRHLVHARTSSDSDDSSDDDDEAMSDSQLNKHSKAAVSPTVQEPNGNKILDAKLERMVMKSNAAQHKENRMHSLPSQTSYRTSTTSSASKPSGARYLMCMWRAPQTKKHKTWDGDACLILGSIHGNKLVDCSNKQILAQGFRLRSNIEVGDQLTAGSKEIEIDREISEREYKTGRPDPAPQATTKLQPKSAPVQMQAQQTGPVRQFKTPAKLPTRGQRVDTLASRTEPVSSVSAESFYAKPSKASERVSKVKPSGLFNSDAGESSKSRHDAEKQGSIVMKRPDTAHQKEYNPKGLKVLDVMVNPILAKALRPHQIEGIRFLYEKVTGIRCTDDDNSFGAILADEMGLGKTVQAIAVIEMLLTQCCYDTPNGRTIERALIVCPLSLVKNWAREFRKWLGDKIKVQCIDDKAKVSNTINGNYQVLIIGYEKLLISQKAVAGVQPKFGLIVCDEAHRLKNIEAKTSKMFDNFTVERRILLTGTPIQNNLREFHAMVDLVAPELLGDQKTFIKAFEKPILESRKPDCPRDKLKKGKDRSEVLQIITSGLLLRRTADILSDYLPPKHEQVVFCSPSAKQIELYQLLINSSGVHDIVSGNALHSFALTAIGVLMKLCNSPELLIRGTSADGMPEGDTTKALVGGLRQRLPTQVMNVADLSGKLLCLVKMLTAIKQQTQDKVVLISNFTSTLDIIEALCRKNKFSFVRMDGKTKQEERMHCITNFNQSDQSSQFIFLLSKKTGGTGINLIGANRLILFDTDWNPSNDRQAMARIHRDGQKKPCFIYRLLIPGTMDEKIYQRQISKLSLSDSLMDNQGKSSKNAESFSQDELRSIFQLHLDTRCLSHDQMRCTCEGNGIAGAGMGDQVGDIKNDDSDDDDSDDDDIPPPATFTTASQILAADGRKENEPKLSALLRWAHHDCASESTAPTQDPVLNSIIEQQHQKGIYTKDEQDPKDFDMTEVKPGSILYVYAESSTKLLDEASPIDKDNL